MPPLLDQGFLRELGTLERRLEIVARSRHTGERLALLRGSSAEFEQHRPYVPGDDVRRIDWSATARSGTPVLKQFRSEEDPLLRVLLDRSLSLAEPDSTKLDLAKRVSAALGYLGLHAGARVELAYGPAEAGDGAGFFEPRRGRRALASYLAQLEGLAPLGRTELARWVRDLVARTRRPGLLVVVSDFFDHEPILRELDLARGQGHTIALCQVLGKNELEPAFEGDVELVDVETEERVQLTLDQAALDAYLGALLDLVERLRAWSRQRGQGYARVTSGTDLVPALTRLVLQEQD